MVPSTSIKSSQFLSIFKLFKFLKTIEKIERQENWSPVSENQFSSMQSPTVNFSPSFESFSIKLRFLLQKLIAFSSAKAYHWNFPPSLESFSRKWKSLFSPLRWTSLQLFRSWDPSSMLKAFDNNIFLCTYTDRAANTPPIIQFEFSMRLHWNNMFWLHYH